MKNHIKAFLFMSFQTKVWLVQKLLRIRFDKVDRFTRIYDDDRVYDIYYCLALKYYFSQCYRPH